VCLNSKALPPPPRALFVAAHSIAVAAPTARDSMAAFWTALRSEVLGTVEDFCQKGALGALRDAALDVRDMAADAGSYVLDGIQEFVPDSEHEVARTPLASAPTSGQQEQLQTHLVVRSATVPVRGATVDLEQADGAVVEAFVVDIDGVSFPPRARVTVGGVGEPLLVNVLLPGAAWGEQAGFTSLFDGLQQELWETVQDFREKGAFGAVRDAALDTVDIVSHTARSAVDGAVSLAGGSGASADEFGQVLTEDESQATSHATPMSSARDAVVINLDGGEATAAESDCARLSARAPTASDFDESASEAAAGSASEAGDSTAEIRAAGAALFEGLKKEFHETVQDIREKGAVGTVKDVALDAVDIVESTATMVAAQARSLAGPQVDTDSSDAALGGDESGARASGLPDGWQREGRGRANSDARVVGPPVGLVKARTEQYNAAVESASEAASANSPKTPPGGAVPQEGGSRSGGDLTVPRNNSLVSMRRNIFEKPKERPKKDAEEEALD